MNQTLRIDRPWIVQEKLQIPGELQQHLPYHEIILQTLVRRGLAEVSAAQRYLDHHQYTPASPFDLPDMNKGIDRLSRAISNNQVIGVWGDFDVDGQTSTTILVSALRAVNARHIYHIPVRGRESHGIGLDAFKVFISAGVDLILTCDTGVTAHESIAYAKSNGIDTIITDHHLLPVTMPDAVAVINPRRLSSAHPLSTLPGAGTALKFAEALLASRKIDLDPTLLHDLAALGIIADLADLVGDTRYLAQSGLETMRVSPRPALAAILDAAEVNHTSITEEQVSFALAPRLNAVGRLADANPIVKFLLSHDPAEIRVTVSQVEGLNSRRKLLCDQVFTGALSLIEQDRSVLDHAALVLHHPEWPGGVVGIVASRLVEIYHRPVILLTGIPGQPLRGSARSVEGIDITAALRSSENLLLNYGGHPMAAGLSLPEENFSSLIRRLDNVLEDQMSQRAAGQRLLIDEMIKPADVTIELARSLEVLAPYGPGNPPLVFGSENMRVLETRSVGKLGEHLLVDVEDPSGAVNRLIWWNGTGLPLPHGRFSIAYTPRATNYRGEEQVSLEWIDYHQAKAEIIPELLKMKKSIENIDLRQSGSPVVDLEKILGQGNVQVWKEGNDAFGVSGLSRINLQRCPNLVIWSVPATYTLLRQILQTVHPKKIYWFLISPVEHQLTVFLRQLASLVKHQLSGHQSVFSSSSLAASLAANEEIVELGIGWLAAKGAISIENRSTDGFSLKLGAPADPAAQKKMEQSLSRVFQELQAFAGHMRQTDLARILEELR